MGKYFFYILFAYGVTGATILALVVHTILDYRRLLKSLAQFPPREGDDR